MLSKSFKPKKCKTALKLAMARIKLLKNKREAQVKQMRRELAQLLETGQEQTARIRVEHVIREEKTMSAYELIEIYCELIVARLPIIEAQKSCPIDLKEAISSVVFASPRCADIPELMDVRKHFVAKYGKEFVTSALEVRPDCGVNRMVVEKLSANAPDIETKIKTLTAISQEHNVKWDSKALEEQLHKPNADLLNGPNTFASASKMPMEPSHANLSSATNQKNESTMKLFQNDVTSKPTSMNAFSRSNIQTPSTSVSSTSQYESRAPDIRSGGEFKNSSSMEENASLDRPVWNMEFKDATSAAQAAAESAERASMAARAAVELASRGNVSRQFSTGSHESSTYGTSDNKPVKVKVSNLEGAHIVQESVTKDDDELKRSQGMNLDRQGAHIVQESVTKDDDELKRSQGMNLDRQNLQRDEIMQVSSRIATESIYGGHASFRGRPLSRSSSHSSGTSINDDVPEVNLHKADMEESIYGGHASFRSRPLSRSSSHSSGTSINDDVSEVNLHKADMEAYGHAQRSFSEPEPADQDFKNKKNKNAELGKWDSNKSYNKSASHFTGSVFDDDTKWDSNIQKHDNDNGEDSITGAGKGIFGSDQKQPIISDSSAVAFDDYGSDTDNVSIFGSYNEGHLLDSFLSNQREEPSIFPSAVDTLSPKQHRSGSIVKDSNSQLHFVKEPYSVEHSESIKNIVLPSQSYDNLPAAFDYSDGLSSESEGEMTNSPVPSGGYEKNHEPEPKSADKIWTRSGSSGLPIDQPSSRNDKTPRNSINSERGSYYCPPDEEPQPWQSSKVSATEEAETKDKFGMPSSHSDSRDTEISNEFNSESGHGLNLGRLTGGFRNKGFQCAPYVKSPLADASVRSERTSNYTSVVIEKPNVSRLDKSSASLEFPDQERYDKESHLEDFMSNSRISRGYMESDFDKAEVVVSRRTFGRRGYRGEAALSSNKSAEVTSDINQRPIVSRQEIQDKISEDLEVPALESSNQRPHWIGYKELRSNSPVSYSNPDSIEQPHYTVGSRRSRGKVVSVKPEQSTDVPPIVEAPKVELYDQRQHRKAYNELSSKMPFTYFESDDDELEELDQRHTVGHRENNDVKLSHWTRDLPSEVKNSHSRFTGRSDVLVNPEKKINPAQASSPASEPPHNTSIDTINLEGKESSRSLQRNLSTEQPSVTPTKSEYSAYRDSPKSSKPDSTQSVVPGNNGNPTTSSSSKGLSLRENSLKNASHVHPKLPDYDALAAHFQSLRSNRR